MVAGSDRVFLSLGTVRWSESNKNGGIQHFKGNDGSVEGWAGCFFDHETGHFVECKMFITATMMVWQGKAMAICNGDIIMFFAPVTVKEENI